VAGQVVLLRSGVSGRSGQCRLWSFDWNQADNFSTL
jgi:hypothetical protein